MLRTVLQHLWAEISERLSDKIDPAIKYGGGSKGIQILLNKLSEAVENCEKAEMESTREAMKEGLTGIIKMIEDEL